MRNEGGKREGTSTGETFYLSRNWMAGGCWSEARPLAPLNGWLASIWHPRRRPQRLLATLVWAWSPEVSCGLFEYEEGKRWYPRGDQLDGLNLSPHSWNWFTVGLAESNSKHNIWDFHQFTELIISALQK